MSANILTLEDCEQGLDLEPAPRVVQLRPPEVGRLPLALVVLGNVLVGAALLAGLLFAPAMMSALLLPG